MPADAAEFSDFGSRLWESAEQLRRSVESSEYKYIVIEILFLKHISSHGDELGYTVPEEARWEEIATRITTDETDEGVRAVLSTAIDRIESRNDEIEDVFLRAHSRTDVPDSTLTNIVELFDSVEFGDGEDSVDRDQDYFGRIYEYFLANFAKEEGRRGGEFYTPKYVVELLVTILEPKEGVLFDPFCGSGGIFVQSYEYVSGHNGGDDLEIYGQEVKRRTWRIGRANLLCRDIDGEIRHGDSITDDQYPDLEADRIITNPPFNMEEWGQENIGFDDERFRYGVPSETGNFAYLQHMIHHLADDGMIGTVMSNGALSIREGNEGAIRRRIVEGDLVDVIIDLPMNLFYSTTIPSSVWVLSKGKDSDEYRDRGGETLFIDAKEMYKEVDNSLNVLREEHIEQIASTIRAYRGEDSADLYRDVDGYCKRARIDDIADKDYVLTPGTYVGRDNQYRSDAFTDEVDRLQDELETHFEEAEELNEEIEQMFERIGYQ